MPARALLVLAAALLAIGCGGPLFRLAEAPPLAAASWRVLLAAAILAPIAIRDGLSRDLRALDARGRWLLLGAGAALAAHFGFWVPSLSMTSVASSVVLVTTSPLLVALLGATLLGERPSAALLGGTAVAFLGAAVIALGDASRGGHALAGDALALAGAVAAAVYFVVGRRARRNVPIATYAFSAYATSGAILAAASWTAGMPPLAIPPQSWPWLVLLALVPQLVGHTGLNWALSRLSATYVAAVTLGEPLVSTVLAWWWLGERPPGSTVAGGALVLAGLAVATRAELAVRARATATVPPLDAT